MKSRRGFTLIELLTVIAIIALISAVVLSSLNMARAKARDTKRKQDMLQVRTALQAYYADNGRYPMPFGGVYPSALAANAPYYSAVSGTGIIGSGTWCGTQGTLSGANAYIQGLVPTYMAQLPLDPQGSMAAGVCNGYVYASDGKNYKFINYLTPESTIPTGATFYDPVSTPSQPDWMLCSSGVDANSTNDCNNW